MIAKRVVEQLMRGAAALLIVLGVSVAGVAPSLAAIDLSQQRQFDIAPQPLSSALLKFSAQSDIQVTVPGQLAEGKQSPGVVGKFNAGSALAILLKDTTLRYDVVDGSTVVITGPAERKAAARSDYQKINDPVLACRDGAIRPGNQTRAGPSNHRADAGNSEPERGSDHFRIDRTQSRSRRDCGHRYFHQGSGRRNRAARDGD